MERKTFYSKLFKRNINQEEADFWQFLYAELLHRLREIDDLYCFCEHCQENTDNLNRIIKDMEKAGVIEENRKPRNFAGKGYCKKKMLEDSEKAARIYKK